MFGLAVKLSGIPTDDSAGSNLFKYYFMKPRLLLFMLSGWTFAVAVLCLQAEKSMELPPAIAKIVAMTFPDAEIRRVEREEDDGEEEFEIRLKSKSDGRELFVEIRTDSGVTRLREEIKSGELPPKIRKALNKSFPTTKITKVEKSSEIRMVYEIDIESDDRRREVTISPKGKILDVEERKRK